MRRLMTVMGLVLAVGCGGGGGAAAGGEEAGGGEETAGGEYAGGITSTDVALGQEKYQSRCAGCHEGEAPRLENIHWTPERMRQQIREGSGQMAAIPEHRLSADEMEAVIAYLNTIGAVD
ncbi:c-type cytochrome [Sandaracinus amylolyticus]|uniref:c-type cytochrome n=1 Tax=Sandaracinus amylolyticus TaxID=927083 RepID=UPI001F315C2A|nr:cytochrome c [Sandaracinus amylolyticus]UJR79411.1 Cytochrome c domain-containing protein [Sandaracinus amylolyticus]